MSKTDAEAGETLRLDDIPDAVVQEAAERIANFSVGFVTLRRGADGRERGGVGGSGTLAEVDGSRGILTAWHVLSALPAEGEIGLILPSPSRHLQRVTIRTERSVRIKIAYGGDGQIGPDLGFLPLPSVEAGTIAAKQSFVNLVARSEEMLQQPPTVSDGFWMIWGFPAELTEERQPEQGYGTVRAFHSAGLAVRLKRERVEGDYDYIDLGGSVDAPPISFGGCSGGGLWQVSLRRPKGSDNLETGNYWFSGVAFYESEILGDHREIICHGRRSVYVNAMEAIRRAGS